MSTDLDAGRYGSVCENLTRRERNTLAREIATVTAKLNSAGEAKALAREVALIVGKPRGCVGFVAFAKTLAHVMYAKISLGREFNRRLNHRLPTIQVRGDIATDHGDIEARYESGRWRFEGHGAQPPFEVPTIKSDGQYLFPPQ